MELVCRWICASCRRASVKSGLRATQRYLSVHGILECPLLQQKNAKIILHDRIALG